MNQLKNINTWTNASRTLAALGAIMRIKVKLPNNSYGFQINNTSLQCIYAQITDPNIFGDINTILCNIGAIYTKNGNVIVDLQDHYWRSQVQKYDEGKYVRLLWYNLLCCIEDDPSRGMRTHPIIH
eukprot:231723_1